MIAIEDEGDRLVGWWLLGSEADDGERGGGVVDRVDAGAGRR